jgi:hypothetical protein
MELLNGYVPPRTYIVLLVALIRVRAFAIVAKGWVIVPGLLSFPVVATYICAFNPETKDTINIMVIK